MGNIEVRNHFEMIHSLLDQHGFPRDKFRIIPDLEPAGMSWEGNILVREIVGEDEGMPIFGLTYGVRERFLQDDGLRVACLVLHELYHCRNHFTRVSQLSIEERLANELEADEWALGQLGVL